MESRDEARAPHFVSQREAVPGNGPAQQNHPLSQLGGLGEIMIHETGGGGKWRLAESPCCSGTGLSIPGSGAHRGSCWGTLHGEGQEVCRVAS